jgi:hypothetical protein
MAKKHATVKPFSCGECGECFALQGMLTSHVKLVHRKQGAKKAKAKKKNFPVGGGGAPFRVERLHGEEPEAATLTTTTPLPPPTPTQKRAKRAKKATNTDDDLIGTQITTVECKVEGTELIFRTT